MHKDTNLLTGVSIDELEALAAGVLAAPTQSRLEELSEAGRNGQLSNSDAAELDDLLNKVDQLNLLKARARYTLDHLGMKASNT